MDASADQDLAAVYSAIRAYYGAKIAAYGPVPAGADWSCITTQEARFVQLLKLCDFSAPFALNDIGCGYGALATFLNKYHPETRIDYLGVDVSPEMIDRARGVRRDLERVEFVVANAAPRTADYSVASGIFNVKLNVPLERWEYFIGKTLGEMHAASRRGFAVNFMAPQTPDKPIRELYRTLPEHWIRYCETELEASVDLVADYGLREFTLLVRPRRSSDQRR